MIPSPTPRNQTQKAQWERDRRVKVTLRPLRYDYLRDADGRVATDGAGRKTVTGKQEKGVDVLCALALVREAPTADTDLVILASQDTDLEPALDEALTLGSAKVETVTWSDPRRHARQLRPSGGRRLWNTSARSGVPTQPRPHRLPLNSRRPFRSTTPLDGSYSRPARRRALGQQTPARRNVARAAAGRCSRTQAWVAICTASHGGAERWGVGEVEFAHGVDGHGVEQGGGVDVDSFAMIAAHQDGEACVCDLTDPVGLSQPTVSHHLKQLVDAGLITRDQRGRWAYYRVVASALDALAGSLQAQ